MADIHQTGDFPPPRDAPAAPFEARLVNPPTGDPGVLVTFAGSRRAMLLDCGDLSPLSHAELLRVTDVFVTHGHLDHLFGFDRLLRAFLGLTRRLRIHGGEGTVDRIHRKLRSYEWNADVHASLSIEVHELAGDRRRAVEIGSRDRFESAVPIGDEPHAGALRAEEGLRVEFARIPHTVPNLALAVVSGPHAHVDGEALAGSGLAPGPWIRHLTARVEAALRNGDPLAGHVKVSGADLEIEPLARRLVRVTPAWRLAYLTDCAYSDTAREAVLSIARGADLFFCESVFVEADAHKASATGHLTAPQCGRIAREAGVAALRTFHHSPRYAGPEPLLREVRAEFPAAE